VKDKNENLYGHPSRFNEMCGNKDFLDAVNRQALSTREPVSQQARLKKRKHSMLTTVN
jgi:hypothetical protein